MQPLTAPDQGQPDGFLFGKDRLSTVPIQSANQDSTDCVSHARLHQFFEAACDRTPGQIAIQCGTTQLTYSELDARANRLAHHLVRRGIKIGDRVGLLLERSVETYVSLLAILKSGATFVPLDLSYPAERIAFIAEDAGLAMIVTTSDHSGVAMPGCPALAVDADSVSISTEPAARLPVDSRDEAECYIIYTSGTTGRPKGVAVNHSSICNFIEACSPIYGVTSADRVYQGMTLVFDFSIEEIWPAFHAGATIVAGPNDHRRFGSGLADFLIANEITVLACVPTLLATLDCDVPGLRTLLVGGEACPADLVARWARPGRRMLNTYGPTETTVTATWSELIPGRPVTIGRPLPTYSAYILDHSLRRLPAGVSGEICIGGPGVAVGYINRPELTAEKFLPDPFSDIPGARLYRTGDLGALRPDGEIEYQGRIDSQVKIRGYRIELSEIEAAILETGQVLNAVVNCFASDDGSSELVAYIVPRPGTDLGIVRTHIHTALRERLPAYMVPAYIEAIASRADASESKKPIADNYPDPQVHD